MPIQTNGGTCLLPIGTVTQAMRAREVLARGGISAIVVRNDPAATGAGCAYAVSYPCEREREARRLLRGAGIRRHGGGRI